MAMKHFVEAEVEVGISGNPGYRYNAMIPIEDIRAILEVPGQDKTVILLLDGIKASFSWDDEAERWMAAADHCCTPVQRAQRILERLYCQIEGRTPYRCYLHTVHAYLFEGDPIPVIIDNA